MNANCSVDLDSEVSPSVSSRQCCFFFFFRLQREEWMQKTSGEKKKKQNTPFHLFSLCTLVLCPWTTSIPLQLCFF